MPIPISAIVLTKNSELLIADCLESLSWANELLVVDSYSTDQTVAIAQKIATRVIQHPFQDYAAQRNFAQSQAIYDWVLFVDADERVSPKLRESISTLAATEQLCNFNAYYLHRIELFSGIWFPDPERAYMPANKLAIAHNPTIGMLRLFDRRLGTWERSLHEIINIPKPHGMPNGVLYHYSMSNLSVMWTKFNDYTDLEAMQLHKTRHKRVSIFESIFRALRHAVYVYFYYEYWRYGEHGLHIAILGAITKFVNYTKLDERIRIQNQQGTWTPRDRHLLDRYNTNT